MAETDKEAQVGLRKALTTAHFVGIGLYNTFRPLFLVTIISPDQVSQPKLSFHLASAAAIRRSAWHWCWLSSPYTLSDPWTVYTHAGRLHPLHRERDHVRQPSLPRNPPR